MFGLNRDPEESQVPPAGLDVPADSVTWPNQVMIPDGVVPAAEIPQDEDFFNDNEDDLDLEMED